MTRMTATFVFVALWLCCAGLQLSGVDGGEDGKVVYACANGVVSLPWTLNIGPNDHILDVQWFFEGRSHEIIATLANGVFFASPSYSGRVAHTTNAGIEIRHVTTAESGNYSVQVIGRGPGGDVITLTHWMRVHISDSLQTSGGGMRVQQEPEPAVSVTSGQLQVVLSCGTFTYPTHPPFNVSWTSPSGHQLNSTDYKDGVFYLHLPNPVNGGNYTCTVPPTSGCVHGHEGEATLLVDQAETRMTLLESQQARLMTKNVALEKQNLDLQAALAQLTDLVKRSVSFHAKMTSSVELPANSVLRLTEVTHNQGQGYDPSTGKFRAPFNGTYFLAASTEATTTAKDVTLSLMAEGRELDFLWVTSDTHTKAGGVQAVVSLAEGEHAWLQTTLPSHFWHQPTSFTGFLVNL